MKKSIILAMAIVFMHGVKADSIIRYAIAFGNVSETIGHFVPGSQYLANIVTKETLDISLVDKSNTSISNHVLYSNSVYGDTAYQQGTLCVLIKVDRLTPNKEHEIRLHSVDPYIYGAAGKRTFVIDVNDVKVSGDIDLDVARDSGGHYKPWVYSVVCGAAEQGEVRIQDLRKRNRNMGRSGRRNFHVSMCDGAISVCDAHVAVWRKLQFAKPFCNSDEMMVAC